MATIEAGSTSPPKPKMIFGRFRFWMFMVGLVTILTGLLFGYDQGVISGALQFIAAAFHLGTTLQEVVTSWVTLGALIGALIAGGLADRLGRKPTMMIGGALFAVGALGETLAPGTWILVISRFVIGFGVGVASVAGPLYAAEMAPSSDRGRYVSSYQLAVTIGILLADIADAVLSPGGHWRVMLACRSCPACCCSSSPCGCPTRPGGTCRSAGAPTLRPPWPRSSAARTWTAGSTTCRPTWPRPRA